MVEYTTCISMKVIDIKDTDSSEKKRVDAESIRNLGSHLAKRSERVAVMMELLAVKGFAFTANKNTIFAVSRKVEAQEAKSYLLQKGFHDSEFQVYLEYTREWGIL